MQEVRQEAARSARLETSDKNTPTSREWGSPPIKVGDVGIAGYLNPTIVIASLPHQTKPQNMSSGAERPS